MNKPFQTPSTLVPMRSTAVNFTSGMIVNDTDLTAAMHYPVQLMQAVNLAVYGCGVVCGFQFLPDPDVCGKTKPCDPCEGQDSGDRAYPGFTLRITRGTAIDGFGLPIELCEPADVELRPETCGCKSTEGKIWIAIRRVTATEAPRGDCCDDPTGPAPCTRSRDHVEIRGFAEDKLPEHICWHGHDGPGGPRGCGCGDGASGSDGSTGRGYDDPAKIPTESKENGRYTAQQRRICGCLMKCDPCEPCGEGWVLLGCVEYCEAGLKETNFPARQDDGSWGPPPIKPYLHRKWIKLIECLCRHPWDEEGERPREPGDAYEIDPQFNKQLREDLSFKDDEVAFIQELGVSDLAELRARIEWVERFNGALNTGQKRRRDQIYKKISDVESRMR